MTRSRNGRLARWYIIATSVAILAAAPLWADGATAAERYALLVGVTRYDNLRPSYQLKGPANDVELLGGILPGLGFPPANIRVLAEPPLGSQRPTRAAVLGELDRLAETARSGDYVYIHFSGHGSRQPASSALPGAAESGGFQDIFLPSDAGRWEGSIHSVVNAITSHEFGQAIRKIRAQGAFVWAVVDSCHSGAIVRALPATDDDERERQVDPADLGVPGSPDAAASAPNGAAQQRQLANDQELDARSSGFVGFFAAQSDEATVEMHLPRGAADGKVHGLFTFTLAQALTSRPDATYRSLSESILRTYVSLNRLFPTPSFEGDGLDSRVFGGEPRKTIRQWPLVKKENLFEIEAGSLHQLSKGSILAVLPNADADPDQIRGYLEIAEIDLVRSRLKAVAYRDMAAVNPDEISEQAVARLVHPKWASEVRVALPAPPRSAGALETEAYRLLTNLAGRPDTWAGQVQPLWVDPKKPADIRLMLEGSQLNSGAMLWLLPPSGEIVRSGPLQAKGIHLESSGDDLRPLIVSRIGRAVRALTLKRISQEIASRQPEPLVALHAVARRRGSGKDEHLVAGRIPVVRDGDEITFTVTNQATEAIDVTMLYVDSNDRISVLYPAAPGGPNRIEQRGRHSVRVRVSAQTTGLEQLLVVARSARPLAPRSDFSFLADEEQVVARGSGLEMSGPLSVFEQAGFTFAHAREIRGDISDQVDAAIFPLRVEVPK